MTPEELVSYCKNKDWDHLFPILSSSLKDLSIKILVTAVIQTHHEDSAIVKQRGLGCWEDQLSGNVLSGMSSLFSSSVDLLDFTRAFYTAKDLLKDSLAAHAIRTFVRKHKLILGQKILRDSQLPEDSKQKIRDAFGDLRVSRYERETQTRQQQTAYRQAVTEHLKAVDQVKEQLVPVLGLKARLFSISFPAPEHAKAFHGPFGSYPEIHFDQSIKTEEFKTFEKKLAAYGIQARGHDMSFMYGEGASRGIQIFSGNAVDITKKLASPPQVVEAAVEDSAEAEKRNNITP